jgi:hypothetical protein
MDNNINDLENNNVIWSYPVEFNDKNNNIVFLIYNEIIDIVNNNITDLINFNLNKINILQTTDIILLFEELSKIIISQEIYTYKNNYYKPLTSFIINIILEFYRNNKIIDLNYNSFNLLCAINTTKNAHIELKKIKNILLTYNYINFNILLNATQYGTLPTFLFWWDFYKAIKMSNLNFSQMLSSGILNNDDRIFKYLLNIINNYSEIDYPSIITSIFTSTINKKHILKKIKLLSEKKNLSKYYKLMLNNITTLKTINILSRYYYTEPLDHKMIMKISVINDSLELLTDNKFHDEYIIFYNNLKTANEKNLFKLFCYLNNKLITFDNNIKIKINTKILNDEFEYVLVRFNSLLNQIVDNKNILFLLNDVLKYYTENNYINKFIDENLYGYNNLIYYSKFLKVNINSTNSSLCISANKALHLLRCCIKRKINNRKNIFNYNFRPIINEITNYKPNIILKNGSYNYQLLKQKFNNIPPRHLLPYENILNKTFLIKEKADGILTKNLPLNIYPYNNEIYNYEIKAEFIEKYNLYLIFDINIPNYSIIDRQIFLKKLFNLNNDIKKVNNFSELINEILEERNNLSKFISLNNNKILWYPKAAWEIHIDENNYNELTNVILEKNNLRLFNSQINIDGFILTPLNELRELKIKPKSLLTIDLLYNGENWIDSNFNIYHNILNVIIEPYIKNKIYRCYPIMDNNQLYFKPKEIRYDKKYPNDNYVIEQIINIYNFNWTQNFKKEKYYQLKNHINSAKKELIKIFENHTQILNNIIKNIEPNLNNNWLDLGCGKCKLLKTINKYYPKKYLGIDKDTDILTKSLEIKNLVFDIYPCDLSNKWDKENLWNNFNWNIKYNYIFANFSLMYYCNDIFWQQLNNITVSGSKFIFNIVKENSKWENNGSYLISNEKETEIYFNWVHSQKIIEPLITHNTVNNYINNYKWTILCTYEFLDKPLTNCYKWYVIKKI